MRQVKLLLTFLLIMLAAASCKTVSYVSCGIDVKLKDAKQEALNAELKVDLTQKVTATSDMQDSKKDAIINAYYKCITSNNIDVVVDPIVKITKYSIFTSASVKEADNAKWWKPQFKAEINGYSGKYTKIETDEEQVKKFDNIDMNSVIKYKLITDPEFHKSYYNNQKSNNVFINNSTTPNKRSNVSGPLSKNILQTMAPAPNAEVKNISYSDMMAKGKTTRKVGIAFAAVGVALLAPVGGTLYSIKRNTYNYSYGYSYRRRPYELPGLCCMGIGAGLTVIGIGCIAGGTVKIKNAKDNDMTLAYNLTPNGAQLALNF